MSYGHPRCHLRGFGRPEEEEELLGRGATGRVVLDELAHPPHTKVAVKLIEAGSYSEVDAGPFATWAHPNVVHVICRLKDERGRLIEVRELMRGGEVFDEVAESGAMAVLDAASFLFQAACGVAHMHAEGMANGQLRLEHMLRDNSGRIKLLPSRHSVCARPGAPPSVALRPLQPLDPPEWRALPLERDGGRGYNRFAPRASLPAADVWSLGVALATALDGQPPYESSDPAKCPTFAAALAASVEGGPLADAQARLARGPTSGSALESAGLVCLLRDLTLAMLHPDPTARPTAAAVLEHLSTAQALLHLTASGLPPCAGSHQGVSGATPVPGMTVGVPASCGYEFSADETLGLAGWDSNLDTRPATPTVDSFAPRPAVTAPSVRTGARVQQLAGAITKHGAPQARSKRGSSLAHAVLDPTSRPLLCDLNNKAMSRSTSALSEATWATASFDEEHKAAGPARRGGASPSSLCPTSSLRIKAPAAGPQSLSAEAESDSPSVGEPSAPLTPSSWLFGQ
jgi:serine/threonine protein kinase